MRQDVLLLTPSTLHWNQSVMPKPVSLLTVQEAHKEYSSLTDQIRAKYKQLDSGEFGSPGTPAFDAEACELANLLAHVSQLGQRLNLPMPKELYRRTFFKHWRHFSDQNLHRQAVLIRIWRMQICSDRYVRITGLLSTPLVNVRIGDSNRSVMPKPVSLLTVQEAHKEYSLACNHPCSWQVQET